MPTSVPEEEQSVWSFSNETDLLALENTTQASAASREKEPIDESDDDEAAAEHKLGVEKARVQSAIFTAWLSKKAEQSTTKELTKPQAEIQDGFMSMGDLMAKQESQAIISDPRAYQLELFERAKGRNTIAVLDTGSGKTLIAVLLLKHVLEQEMENRAKGLPQKVAFFLVDKVALCYQQFAVLEANLDQPVEKLCGETNIDAFSRSEWERILTDNKVVVCTADVLYNVLGKAFVTMKQINLLVFDEAHHTKKNHAFARIIKDFYIPEQQNDRPHIFGMSASPIDAKEDVAESAHRLETLLHAQISTTPDTSLLQYCIAKPQEIRLPYGRRPDLYLTSLGMDLENRYGDIRVFERLFHKARDAASELGDWCADHFWLLTFDENEVYKFEAKTEHAYHGKKRFHDVNELNEEISRIREAGSLVRDHIFATPEADGPNVSSKAKELNDFLFDMYLHNPKSRTLIFVQKRSTARLLADLLRRIGSPHIDVDVLTGINNGEPGEPAVSVRQQMVTLHKFRHGQLNVLITTSVAEEGLDIPDCNCVIRFDLFTTMIQYVQSRGRARHTSSKFVTMIETGNKDHERILYEARLSETKMRQFCNALPKDHLLQNEEDDLQQILAKEKNLPSYTEPETGAKLTFNSAMMTLEYFISMLPQGEEEPVEGAAYSINVTGQGFVCEIVMPLQSPIGSVTGYPYSRKSLAKRSAAFEMCLLLRSRRYLDQDLMPIYHKQLPAMRNAHLALNVKTTNSYSMRLKPMLWECGQGSKPTELYITILSLENMTVLGQAAFPIVLLTRERLPLLPEFPLFPAGEARTTVRTRSLDSTVHSSAEQLIQLSSFTLQTYYDLFNKKFENEPTKMSYWLAPASGVLAAAIPTSDPPTEPRSSQDLIDWGTVEFVHHNPIIGWNEKMVATELENRLFVDKWDGGKRYFSLQIMPEMQPMDPVPAGCVPAKNMNNILEYSISLYDKSRSKAKGTWILPQPVIKARYILPRRNLLEEWSKDDRKAGTLAYLCPEPLRISAIPASVAAMLFAFPSIIHRIEEYLVAIEGAQMLGLTLKPALALEAMTKDSDNTEQHRLKQIHFQRGMGKNYERLEFIGDTFLKMATSISLYAKNAGDDEFESHVKRMLMVCNKNLFNHAVRCNLFEYIRTHGFSRRTWYPDGLMLLEGKGKNIARKAKMKHSLNDKSIADVCEALIGAALLSSGNALDMDMAVKAVTVMVQSADHAVQSFAEYKTLYSAPAWQSAPATAAQLDLVEQLERVDGYRFRSPRLLRSAFVHPSQPFSRENVPSYQRLEFLGDALIDMACVRWLFDRFPDRDPQWLTEHKMAMVSNQFLGALAVQLGLHRHIKHNHAALLGPITEYAAALHAAKDEAPADQMDWWLVPRAPPKCLADVLEAYVGALFIDSGFEYVRVVHFFQKHIVPFFEDMRPYDDFAQRHPAAALASALETLGCSQGRVMGGALPSIANGTMEPGGTYAAAMLVHAAIVAEAEGQSLRQARARAGELAVQQLEGLSRSEFVKRFACDCAPTQTEGAGEESEAAPESSRKGIGGG